MRMDRKYLFPVLVAILVLAIGCGKGSPAAPDVFEDPETFTNLTLEISYIRFDPSPGVPREGRDYPDDAPVMGVLGYEGNTVSQDVRSWMEAVAPGDWMEWLPENELVIQVSSRGTRIEFWASDSWRYISGNSTSVLVGTRFFFFDREVGREHIYITGTSEHSRVTIWPDGSFTAW